jgi:hypothetical protein
MPEDLKQFCLIDFLAEVRNATSHIELSVTEKGKIEGNTIGTVIKLLYAFVWQEEALVTNDIFLDPFVNSVNVYTVCSTDLGKINLFRVVLLLPQLPQNLKLDTKLVKKLVKNHLNKLSKSVKQTVHYFCFEAPLLSNEDI